MGSDTDLARAAIADSVVIHAVLHVAVDALDLLLFAVVATFGLILLFFHLISLFCKPFACKVIMSEETEFYTNNRRNNMSLFTIADLHLSTLDTTNKSMEVFGKRWTD